MENEVNLALVHLRVLVHSRVLVYSRVLVHSTTLVRSTPPMKVALAANISTKHTFSQNSFDERASLPGPGGCCRKRKLGWNTQPRQISVISNRPRADVIRWRLPCVRTHLKGNTHPVQIPSIRVPEYDFFSTSAKPSLGFPYAYTFSLCA